MHLAPHEVQEEGDNLNLQILSSSWLTFGKAFLCCKSYDCTSKACDETERIVDAEHVVYVNPVDANKHRGQ